jgi:two-component system KDP operon response regulator KdpE
LQFQDKIFERFFRVGSRLTGNITGWASLICGACQSHGGKMVGKYAWKGTSSISVATKCRRRRNDWREECADDEEISILLVDDDPQLIRLVRANLDSVGYKVTVAGESVTALKAVDLEMPDLIILDIMLPDMNGYELCRRIREFSTVPIIMLTAKVEDVDKVKGLKVGADDYLTKPFNMDELLARVEAVLRRTKYPENIKTPPSFTCGDISVDFAQRRVSVRGKEVPLTLIEYKLLSQLVSNADRIMLHRELLTKVWGPEYQDEVDYLRAYIRHLRQKIEEDPHQPKYILSKLGIGYLFSRSCN